MNTQQRDLLYRSFDDTLSEEERHRLDEALASSPELRDEYERLVQMRQMVSDGAEGSFQPWFAQRVMRRIASEGGVRESDLFFEELFSMFRRVAIAAATAAVITISYNLYQSDSISIAATFGLQEEPALEEMLDVTLALESEGAL